MTKTTGIFLTFIAIVALVFAAYFFKRPPASGKNVFVAVPVKFVYKPGAPGVAAHISGKEVTEAELLERSPVLMDLAYQEIKMLGEAALKTHPAKNKKSQSLEVFMADPGEKFKASLEKLKLPLEVKFSSENPGKSAAKLNGTAMTAAEIGVKQVPLSHLKSRQFSEKLNVLRDLFVKQILFKAAAADGKNIEEFLDLKVLTSKTGASDQEVNDFMNQKGITFSKDGKESQSVRNRLRLIIIEQKRTALINAYIERNFSEQGEIHFLPPQQAFPMDEKKMIADKAAGVPVLVFSNLQCSTCLQLAKNLFALKEKHKDDIRIGLVSLFSEEDWRSRLAAEASLCLNAQNHKYFWDFYQAVTNRQAAVDEAAIYETAKKVGADEEPFKNCILKQTYKEEVNGQLKYAAGLGVVTMPTVIVGGTVLAGTVSLEELEHALAAAGVN